MTAKRTFFPRAQVLAYLAENGPTDTLSLCEAIEHNMTPTAFLNGLYAMSDSLHLIDKVAGRRFT